MRHGFLVAFFCFLVAPPAEAQDAQPPAESPAMPAADRVQLVEDDENGRLRIVIDGKVVGWFDAGGLNVNGDINYTGFTADVGSLPGSGAAHD
jgi:hypothetical protein